MAGGEAEGSAGRWGVGRNAVQASGVWDLLRSRVAGLMEGDQGTTCPCPFTAS